jgi:hypothetical protein
LGKKPIASFDPSGIAEGVITRITVPSVNRFGEMT